MVVFNFNLLRRKLAVARDIYFRFIFYKSMALLNSAPGLRVLFNTFCVNLSVSLRESSLSSTSTHTDLSLTRVHLQTNFLVKRAI